LTGVGLPAFHGPDAVRSRETDKKSVGQALEGEVNMSRMSYRFTAALCATVLSLVLSAATALASDKLIVSNWDGYSPPDLMANFSKDTGIAAEMVLHATNEEIVGKLLPVSGKGYDVVFVSAPFVELLAKAGLLAELDHAKIPNLANLYPEARNLDYDPDNKYSAPYAWGTTGLCYRSDVLKAEPTSWMDLLKPADALKRRVTMLSTERWLMAAGLRALGYSINSRNADEIAKAKELLIAAKPSLLAYDDTTFYQKLLTGDADLVHAWDAGATTASPRTTRSNLRCRRKAATCGSTPWS